MLQLAAMLSIWEKGLVYMVLSNVKVFYVNTMAYNVISSFCIYFQFENEKVLLICLRLSLSQALHTAFRIM